MVNNLQEKELTNKLTKNGWWDAKRLMTSPATS